MYSLEPAPPPQLPPAVPRPLLQSPSLSPPPTTTLSLDHPDPTDLRVPAPLTLYSLPTLVLFRMTCYPSLPTPDQAPPGTIGLTCPSPPAGTARVPPRSPLTGTAHSWVPLQAGHELATGNPPPCQDHREWNRPCQSSSAWTGRRTRTAGTWSGAPVAAALSPGIWTTVKRTVLSQKFSRVSHSIQA